MIRHLENSTNTVKSNPQLTVGMGIGISVLLAMSLANILAPNMPLVNSVAANIIIMSLFAFIVIDFIAQIVNIRGFLQKETSNTVLLQAGIWILYALFYISLILFIPEAINSDFGIETWWIQGMIRVMTACILLIPAYVIHKKVKALKDDI